MSKSGRYLKYALLLLLALAVLVGGTVYFFWDRLPYQSFAEREISRQMQVMGITVSDLKVGKLGKSEAIIETITIGDERKSEASGITAGYDWQEIQRGYVRQVEIDSLTLRAYEGDKGWFVAGLEPLMQNSMPSSSPSPLFAAEQIRQTAPQQVIIKKLILDVMGKDFTAQTQGEATFEQSEKPRLSIKLSSLSVSAKTYQLTAPFVEISAVFDAEKAQWEGTLKGDKFQLTGTPEELPPLKAKGDFTVSAKKATGALELNDSKSEKKAAFSLNLPLNKSEGGKLQVKELVFPWGGGILRTEKISVALAGDKPIRIPLQLEQVDLAELLKAVAEDQVKGTGKVSGMVPVIYQTDGKITLEPGSFAALQAGQISVSPELLPEGTREDLDMVRAALSDFRYDSLKISVLLGTDGKPTIQLAVEGSNPETFEGRKIKLNVNLTGDILSLLQQSILPMEDAKELFKLQEKP